MVLSTINSFSIVFYPRQQVKAMRMTTELPLCSVEQKLYKRTNNPLDVLRGLAILDMLLVHFSIFLPNILRKLVVYHDVALDGFILVSGYSMGRFVYVRFKNQPIKCSKRILWRAVKIFLINSFLVGTVGMAQFILTNNYDSMIDLETYFLRPY